MVVDALSRRSMIDLRVMISRLSLFDVGSLLVELQTELGEQRVLGPELVSKTEGKVCLIRDRMKVVSGRQKSYADLKRKDIEYSMRDMVFLKVSPWNKMLSHYRSNPTHIVPVKEIEVRPYLTFEEETVQILERDVKVLRRNSIPLVKVLQRDHSTEEATWELEDLLRQ
ncbi:uncharacterized protein [Gossypium hirsutum]|uniref:DNA/RNA polymerases superfamily protein n=1 Tax=Gossypium hirsutum TaxID=3635 RepID=A0ABM3BJ66_GOSHI|nr:uncharacterized protein LOC121228046 [Gossypium hirsutum]